VTINQERGHPHIIDQAPNRWWLLATYWWVRIRACSLAMYISLCCATRIVIPHLIWRGYWYRLLVPTYVMPAPLAWRAVQLLLPAPCSAGFYLTSAFFPSMVVDSTALHHLYSGATKVVESTTGKIIRQQAQLCNWKNIFVRGTESSTCLSWAIRCANDTGAWTCV
jgi:hypothetical protein